MSAKISKIKLLQPIKEVLRRGLDREISTFVSEALEQHNGCLAGGFARIIALHLDPLRNFSLCSSRDRIFYKQQTNDFSSLCRYYLGYRGQLDRFMHINNERRLPFGDIDIFMPSDDILRFFDRKDILKFLSKKKIEQKHNGFLHEITINDVKIQICAKQQDHITTISDFDITNVMVGFTSTNMLLVDGWIPLEREGFLNVNLWKDPIRTIQRASKMLQRNNLLSLSPKTGAEIVDKALQAIEESKCQNRSDQPVIQVTNLMIEQLRMMMPSLSTDQLLLLSTIVPQSKSFYGSENTHDVLKKRFHESLNRRHVF